MVAAERRLRERGDAVTIELRRRRLENRLALRERGEPDDQREGDSGPSPHMAIHPLSLSRRLPHAEGATL